MILGELWIILRLLPGQGYDYQRITTGTTLPTNTFDNNDWVIVDWASPTSTQGDYSDVGFYTLYASNYEYILNDGTSDVTQATPVFSDLSPGTYTMIVHDTATNCYSDAITYNVVKEVCSIQKGISPNNDGKNDSFDLSGFDVRELQIFNRYGRKVYSKGNYSNEWYGQADNGNELPDGTYYYVIILNDMPSKTGWIYINRAQ